MVNRLVSIDTAKTVGERFPATVITEIQEVPLVNKELDGPLIAYIQDVNGKTILDTVVAASAVNNLRVGNAAAGGSPILAAVGTDTHIDLKLVSKGNGLVQVNGVAPLQGLTSTATSAGVTTLDVRSTPVQLFTGNANHTVKLPSTSVKAGQQYLIINSSAGAVTVQSSAANTVVILAGGTGGLITALIDTPTTNVHWTDLHYGVVVASGKSLSISNTMTLAALAEGKTFTLPNDTVDVAGLQCAQTLLSTRVVPRVGSIASSATPTANANLHDQYHVTALAAGAVFGAPTGVATNGQLLLYRIKDNGVGRSLGWNGIFRAVGVTLPTTTVATKTHYIGTVYNSADVKWDAIYVGAES